MKRSVLWVFVMIAAVLPIATNLAWAGRTGPRQGAATARHGPAGEHYYVDFLARPEGIVGHSYIQVGSLDAQGRRHPVLTEGLYPASPDKVFDGAGKVTALPADLRSQHSVRYSLMVSERTYRKAVAHMKTLPRTWRRYDLVQRNCNNMVADVATHSGLAAPGDTADLPVNYVRSLAAANGGRERASWR